MTHSSRRLWSAALLLLAALNTACSHHNRQTDDQPSMANTPLLTDFTQPQQFRFLPGETSPGVLTLTAADNYTAARGYGFDLNTSPEQNGKPFYFSVRVPEGNYRVTLELGHHTLPSANTVKAESRRLYLENVTTRAGEQLTRSFVVNVRTPALTPPEKNAPGGTRVAVKEREQYALHWDDKLTLEFNGSAPQVRAVTLEKVEVPTVYLIGDSTVTDQGYEPAASWGQMLPRFFGGDVAIANHAESGETIKSFMSGLRLAKVLETLKAGDYLFIQFGHNDQKQNWPQTWADAQTTYPAYLSALIAEARLRGATPVLITSMQRRTFDKHGKILNSHGAYPQAIRDLAGSEAVALIDLDRMSVSLYEALGVARAPLAFNDNGRDATHHNNYGAYQLAKCVVAGIRSNHLPLAASLVAGLPDYDPAKPDPVEQFTLAPSPQISNHRPDGN
ncbi:rhamnogalacturonan acetylesterase [Cellvibrio polysaccharolyticus]|nr:rhamnogalacturonan acetylesterase [Cellvibrio polysaccharolyticus]